MKRARSSFLFGLTLDAVALAFALAAILVLNRAGWLK